MTRTFVKSQELKLVCTKCNRKYFWKSRGYRLTAKCMCGGDLKRKLMEVSSLRYTS
jgi:hypothetical protein